MHYRMVPALLALVVLVAGCTQYALPDSQPDTNTSVSEPGAGSPVTGQFIDQALEQELGQLEDSGSEDLEAELLGAQ